MSTVPLTSNHLTSRSIYYTIVDRAFHSIGNNDSYIYVMVGYTKEGKAKELSFSTSKPIPNGAYLRLYVSMLRGVTYWEEVSADAIPVQAKQLTSKSRKKKIYNGRRAAPYERGSSAIYIIPRLSEPSTANRRFGQSLKAIRQSLAEKEAACKEHEFSARYHDNLHPRNSEGFGAFCKSFSNQAILLG